jgi:hypothetical protein
VEGLKGLQYALLIDGNMIDSFTPQQRAVEVNLALLQTPMEQQAKTMDWIRSRPDSIERDTHRLAY